MDSGPKVLEGLAAGALGALPKPPTVFQLPPDSELAFADIVKRPLVIPRLEKHSYLDVVSPSDYAAATDALLTLGKQAPANVIIRFAGGCKGFEPKDVDELMKFLLKGFVSSDGLRHFQGSVGSGGTQDFNKDGIESVMITQVPIVFAKIFDAVAWGSTPQTHRLRISEEGGVLVSKYGAQLDARGHLNIVTHESAYGNQGWNGDVRWYLSAMAKMINEGHKGGVPVVNGGDVTLDEALLALSLKIPVILVDGTGRAAEQLVKASQDGQIRELYNNDTLARGTLRSTDPIPTQADLDRLLSIVHIKDPAGLSVVTDRLGLLTAA